MDDMTRKQRDAINRGYASLVHVTDQTDHSMSHTLHECLRHETKGRSQINAKALIVVAFTDGMSGVDEPFRYFFGLSPGLLVAAGLGARVATSYPNALPVNWHAICYAVHEAMWPGRPHTGSVFAGKAMPAKPASQSNYREPFYTLTTADIDAERIFFRGVYWPVVAFIGRVLPGDVGKCVYRRGDILQVENNEQRDARLKGEG